MKSLLLKIVAGITGIGLSVYILKGGITYNSIPTVIFAGIAIGLLFFFVKPILNIITLPLRIITLNLFSFVIIMFLVWIVDVLFATSLEINGLKNIFFVSLIVWATDLVFSVSLKSP
ncbi:MAG: phage holin family protein [Candidatus Pacebacteria bacterium]|nr:phage holin family protein [Candidatus Paceibacterota bacterium]